MLSVLQSFNTKLAQQPGVNPSFSRRTGKTINGTTTNFLYDGLNPVQEKNGGTVTANLLTGLGIDEFFTRTDSVGVRALLPDVLGSTVALSDNTGALQTQYTYEPFGVTTQTGAASTSSYKYTGREDDGTGLYYYRARYYQPQLQRFIAEDPIGMGAGDTNLYGYVSENPVRFVDPLAFEKCPSFKNGFNNNLMTTNNFFFTYPTNLSRTAIGLITSGATAKTIGTVTPFQALGSLGSGGIVNMGVTGTLVSAGANILVNSGLSVLSLETGIIIRSAINAGIATLTCN